MPATKYYHFDQMKIPQMQQSSSQQQDQLQQQQQQLQQVGSYEV